MKLLNKLVILAAVILLGASAADACPRRQERQQERQARRQCVSPAPARPRPAAPQYDTIPRPVVPVPAIPPQAGPVLTPRWVPTLLPVCNGPTCGVR